MGHLNVLRKCQNILIRALIRCVKIIFHHEKIKSLILKGLSKFPRLKFQIKVLMLNSNKPVVSLPTVPRQTSKEELQTLISQHVRNWRFGKRLDA